MDMQSIIRAKRDKKKLTKEQLEFFITGYVKDEIPDYQVSALLMAIFLNKMDFDELATLAQLMMKSGEVIDLDGPNGIPGFKTDKHSTGGVGDKVSIPLIAIAAACGCKIPMIAGRGLGHTGGTIDKLEAIQGFNTQLSDAKFKQNVKEIGCCLIGQTSNIAPADKKLYALRDVTSTVESIPLISSSIMSKKLASGTNGLVLDVKTGTGAFMKTQEDAEQLANTMVQIGKNLGKKMVALITNMNQPLGHAIGNSIEIEESIDILKGKTPCADIYDITIEFAAQMIMQSSLAKSIDEAKKMAAESIKNGSALKKFSEMIQAQDGSADCINDYSKLPQAKHHYDIIYTGESGFVSEIDTFKLGITAVDIGAGRKTKETVLDLSVGFRFYPKIGDKLEKNQKIGILYLNKPEQKDHTLSQIVSSITISKNKVQPFPMVFKIIQ